MNSRGGSGRFQGRKIIGSEKMKRVNLTLDKPTVYFFKEQGKGNISAGMRLVASKFAQYFNCTK